MISPVPSTTWRGAPLAEPLPWRSRRCGRDSRIRRSSWRLSLELAILTIVGLLIAPCHGWSKDAVFDNRVYDSKDVPTAILTADFNGDGRLDIAVANYRSADVSIFLGRADGTFGRDERYVVGPQPQAMIASDLHDGKTLDLVVVTLNGVVELPGRGDGTFGPPSPNVAGINPISVASADVNHDGRNDLVVSNAGSVACGETCRCEEASLSLLLNQGDFRFTSQDLPLEGNDCLSRVVAADINADGDPDVVFVRLAADTAERRLALLPGHGDGTFGEETRPTDLALSLALTEGDFNEDGRPDLVAVTTSPWAVTLFLNSGDGSLAPVDTRTSTNGAGDLAAGDMDGDGHLDLLVASQESISIYRGDGHGTFALMQSLAAAGEASRLAVGDFNGDQLPDVAAVESAWSPGLSVFLSHASGMLSTDPPAVSVDRGCRTVVSADLDGDQFPDLAMANPERSSVVAYAGSREGIFRPISTTFPGMGPWALAAKDFDGDGRVDLAAAGGSAAKILYGTGSGGFSSPRVSFPVGSGARGIAIGRFNFDSFPDIVVANQNSDDISVLLGSGTGLFAPQMRYRVAADPFSVAAGDFDGDGLDDVAVANYLGCNCVSVFFARGDGSFAPEARIPDLPGPTYVSTVDLDGDGNLDLVVAHGGGSSGGAVSILRGDGRGGFSHPADYPVGAEPLSLAVADFNGDDILDVATADRGSHEFAVLLAASPGRFSRATRYRAGTEPWSLTAADFNADGKNDVAVLNYISHDIQLFLNRGSVDRPPVARIRTAAHQECTSPRGTSVLLDASSSEDPDSTPGTNDDIVSFVWYEDYETESQKVLGFDERLSANLLLGTHRVTLVATDGLGAVSQSTSSIEVSDSTPPSLFVALSRSLLWPPDNHMVDILADVRGSDACGDPSVVLARIGSTEQSAEDPELLDIQGADFGTLDLHFQLRAARDGGNGGRTYMVTYQATDSSGNTATAEGTVSVPTSSGGGSSSPSFKHF
jgi:hypothetical protein